MADDPNKKRKYGSAEGIAVEVTPGERQAGSAEGIATLASPDTAGPMSRTQAVGHGINSGAADIGLPVMGMTAGATFGSAVPVVGTAIGGLLGLGAGYFAGKLFRDLGDVPRPEELPEELRPFAYGGEVVGGGLAPAAAPFAAGTARFVDPASKALREGAKKLADPLLTRIKATAAGRASTSADDVLREAGAVAPGTRTGRFIDRVLDTAANSPRRTALVEGGSLTAAAAAEGTAEAVVPGETGIRVAAGLAGGILFPNPAVLLGLDAAANGLRRVMTRFSGEGQKSAAAVQLRAALEQVGEDPTELAKLAREADLPELNRTAAQLTGSRTIQEMERLLSRRNGKFGREAAQRADDSLASMRAMIGAMEATGDPQALREAAQIRTQYLTGLLTDQVDAAERQVRELALRIRPDSPEKMTELGRRAGELLDGALSRARAAEREIWSAKNIPKDATLTPNATLAESVRIRKEDLLPVERLPPLAEAMLQRISKAKTPVTVREMLIFRSRMLDEARTASAAGDQSKARVFGHLAESALEDLGGVPGVEAARDYSRTLNDVFTRSFAGDALASNSRGGSRIPPETLMRRATAGGREITALRLAELERAVQMGSPEAANELTGIMESTMRYAAGQLVDPQTGLVNPRQLAKFQRDNAQILERFPELAENLRTTQSASEFLGRVAKRNNATISRIERQSAAARVAGSENPALEIARILGSATPQQQLAQLARTARTSEAPDVALAGLRSAMLDEAFHRAGGDSGNFSFTAYRRALEQPRRAGQPSPIAMMRTNGVLDGATEKRLMRIMAEAEKVEAAMRATSNIDDFMAEASALGDLVMRVAGSRAMAATGASKGVGGASIIMAGAGSRYAQHIFNKVPMNRLQDILIEAAGNPKFLAELLEKPASQSQKIALSRRIHAYLWSAGLREPEEFMKPLGEAVDVEGLPEMPQ